LVPKYFLDGKFLFLDEQADKTDVSLRNSACEHNNRTMVARG